MQDSKYPMTNTKQVLVLAVGYGRGLIDLFLDACCVETSILFVRIVSSH